MSKLHPIDKILQRFREKDYDSFYALTFKTIEEGNLSPILLAKLHAWIAQAKTEQKEYKSALIEYDKAIKYAKDEGDYDGIEELKAKTAPEGAGARSCNPGCILS